MKIALEEYENTRDVDLIYASVVMRENGVKHDYVVPGNDLSETILKNAIPNYKYDCTSYLYDQSGTQNDLRSGTYRPSRSATERIDLQQNEKTIGNSESDRLFLYYL